MPAQIYVSELYNKLQYYATWVPQNDLSLGNIGTMEGKVFTYLDKLENLGIEYEVDKGKSRNSDAFAYQSEGKVEIGFKLAGRVAPPDFPLGEAEAGFGIKFLAEKAIVFQPKGIRIFKIGNQIQLKNQIEDLYRKKQWKKEWVVITELIKVQSATILIAKESGANIGIKVGAEVSALDLADIAKGELDLSFTGGGKSLSVKILGEKSMTPLFKIKGIKSKLFGLNSEFKSRDILSQPIEEEGFDEILIEDLK